MRGATHIHTVRPWNEDTVFDMEIDELEIQGGYFQIQIRTQLREGIDQFFVDWGDGESGWATAYTIWHNYRAAGKYRVRLGGGLRWWRLWEGVTVAADGRYYVSRPAIFPVCWSDYLESCSGTYCGWNSSLHNGGVQGRVIPWGKSLKSTSCCYQYCFAIEGPFPPWTDTIEDATGAFDNCPKMRGPIPPWGRNIRKCTQCYRWTKVYGWFPKWPDKCEEMARCYQDVTTLKGEIPAWPETASVMDSVYEGCTGAVGDIPPWPPNPTWLDRCYFGCANLTGAWTDDPVELMPEEKVKVTEDYYRCIDTVLGCADSLRALFYDKPWGGTMPRPT